MQVDEQIVQAKNDKEYLPITGFPEFTKQAAILAYGKDSKPLQEGRVSLARSPSAAHPPALRESRKRGGKGSMGPKSARVGRDTG